MARYKLPHIFSSGKNKKRALIALFALAFLIFLLISLGKPFFQFFKDIGSIADFVRRFGILAPVAFILLQVLQVLIAPIPGQVAGLASGYLFGVVMGTLYTMIGTTLGSFIAFVLARKYGRPFVERVISKKVLNKFDYLSKERGVFALFLIFLLPALPDDAICFVAGLTKIKIKTLVLITFLGRLPGFFILNLMGNGIAVSNAKTSIILFSILMVISLLIFLYKERLEEFFNYSVAWMVNNRLKKK